MVYTKDKEGNPMVIKKEGEIPKDIDSASLISILSSTDPELSEREIKLKEAPKISEEEEKEVNMDEFEEEDDDNEFKWWSHKDENNYFALVTKMKSDYQPGEQVYNCYG